MDDWENRLLRAVFVRQQIMKGVTFAVTPFALRGSLQSGANTQDIHGSWVFRLPEHIYGA